MEFYLAAAQAGDFAGQYNLGMLYYHGHGVPRDCLLAAKWVRAAAEQGNAHAQHSLGLFYFKGIGVPLDYKEAAKWERLAAEQGEPHAQTDLAYLYESGRGVSLDYIAAYTWYSHAIASGDRMAIDRRKSLSQIMLKWQIDEANAALSSESPQPQLRPQPRTAIMALIAN